PKARWGARMGDAKLNDHMIHDGLWDIVNDFHMGISNDIISEKYNITREEQDRYALLSYKRACDAIQKGIFKQETIPVTILTSKGEKTFETDECPRDTSYEILSQMQPAFQPKGFATAGNSSKISDGAAAVVITSSRKAKELGIQPFAKIVAAGSDGIELKYVLMAPVNSIPKVCRQAGIALEKIDLHEINEAFAGSTIAVLRALGIDEQKVNVNGGSIAIGHPIGASGARVLTTLLYEMKRRNVMFGEASLCLGGGEAVTMIVENI
ncbi:MAG: acetyl-CoA C-acyltransferase, partial [Spirochaetes bacterium]|nr:acetyl-CoA C-acyltransferase [Spirochaetota bacterium]